MTSTAHDEQIPRIAPLSSRPRLLRLKQILAPDGPLPISRSSWWAGVRSQKYPQPIKLGPRTTAWHSADIDGIIQNGSLYTVFQNRP